MAHIPPPLPSRFPCWCRATYSWGGESKNDLGFVEGDLIECLNAGDGSWWMGRLRRDKRAMGLFPSNFVKVLDESFNPVSRGTSPMPPLSASNSKHEATPQKSKTFRKPFQAYNELGARGSSPSPKKEPQIPTRASLEPSPSPSRRSSFINSASIGTHKSGATSSPSRQFSFIQSSKSPSRQATQLQWSSRPASPNINSQYYSRHNSPAPPFQQEMRQIRGMNEDIDESPPPPAPPPHRVAYNAPVSRIPSPAPSMNERMPTHSRGPSPAPNTPLPHSPGISGQTPSPFRDAMDDIMSSLDDMALHQQGQFPLESQREPLDPWSPEAFEELRESHRKRSKRRPRSSLGIASSQRGHIDEYEDEDPPEEQMPSDDWPEASSVNPHEDRKSRNHNMHRLSAASFRTPDELFFPEGNMAPPAPPPKAIDYQPKSNPSVESRELLLDRGSSQRKLRNRKSAIELGRSVLDRTFTTKSVTTDSSAGSQSVATQQTSSTDRTSQSLMSGRSAGGFSATSAGSLARRKWGSMRGHRPMSVIDTRQEILPGSDDGASVRDYQMAGKALQNTSRPVSRAAADNYRQDDDTSSLGGLVTPRKRKSGFFKKLVDSAKTGAANARGTIAAGQIEQNRSPIKNLLPNGVTAIAGGNAAHDMGLGGSKKEIDWVQVRRDINRSNSLSKNERSERIERCQIMDYPVIASEEVLLEEAEGDEDSQGCPVQHPIDYHSVNLQLVDKSARFVNSLPPMTNATSLAQGYVCRPHRSELQRLRAIFTWVSEKVAWEEDFEGDPDPRRVIQMRRGCSREVAVLVAEMCMAAGLHAEVVKGRLKSPGEIPDGTNRIRPNHWWNAVLVDGCWRIMDCSLASPTNPQRSQYSSTSPQVAENGFFLARPTEICYTHVPLAYEHQHICPPIATEVLLALPCACPSYFRYGVRMIDYDTSLFRIEGLDFVYLQFTVAADTECVAEVEASSYSRDNDGDLFENGDMTITRALAQADWVAGQKRYTIKAHLSGDEGHGTLKVYAGKRGLMHSVKDNPHPLAFSLPIVHQGDNPPYEFFLRHPTPHAQRHDLYVAQPQCRRLAINNTFVFAIRQHPSSFSNSTSAESGNGMRPRSPNPFARPSSAMSMMSSAAGSTGFYQGSETGSQTSSQSSTTSSQQQHQKPAKLAIQSPSGRILRLMRKADNSVSMAEAGDGGVWETIIKIGERGTWRGLVLADRSARWCVFGEWECF